MSLFSLFNDYTDTNDTGFRFELEKIIVDLYSFDDSQKERIMNMFISLVSLMQTTKPNGEVTVAGRFNLTFHKGELIQCHDLLGDFNNENV